MLAVTTQDKPEKATRVINEYQGRVLGVVVLPIITLAALAGAGAATFGILEIERITATHVTFGLILALFPLVLPAFSWIRATRNYRKYVDAGYIVEIKNPALVELRSQARSAIDAIPEIERRRLDNMLIALQRSGATPAQIEEVLTRITNGIPL